MEVRRATAADVPALRAVAQAAYLPYVEEIGVRPGPLDADYAAAVAEAETWVAVERGEVVGLLVLELSDPYVLIDNVAVAPQAHGVGIGSRLLDHAEQRARRQGVGELRLFTHERMAFNLAWYARRGFVETHRERVSGLGRVFLTKTL